MEKAKKELLEITYDKFIKIALSKLPLDEWKDIIDENIMAFGTAVDEKLLSFEDTLKLIIDQNEQAKNFDEFKYEINPVFKSISDNENSAIIVSEIDLITVINGEKNTLPLRLSTVLEYKDNKWVVLHWHGSLAEHVSGGDDPWHIGEWKQKAAELEKLVQDKTEDLLLKNKELEIEASLERVRTVAMGMKKSEDLLSICEVSFKELQNLGFKDLRNAVIHVPNDEQKYFMDYDYSDFTGGQIGKVAYGLHPIVDEYLEKIRSAEDAFFEVVIAEDMLEEWNEFRRKSGQMNDQRLDEADALYYYLFSIGIGDIGISTFKPINDSQIKILKRFRNVFDLAYRRYNDIITAEAQVREAQIEAALERVRAKAMAMNSTEDLTQTADVFFSELVKLNITPHRCGFGIVDKETRITDIHATTATKDKSPKIVTGKLKLDDHPILKKIFEGYEKQEEYHPILRGKEITDYYEVMNPQVEFPDFSEDEVQYGYYFYFKEGGVFAWNDEEFTPNELEIFRRYTSVLSLTYRRYIDLKEAELQAKEAQIEAALERVRSRSMGMQKSEELKEVIQVVYEQLVQLNINIEHTGFIMDYKTRDDMHIWLADQNQVPSEIVIPYFDSPHWNSFNEAKANGKDFFANHLSFEEKNIFYQDLFKYIPDVPEETKEYYFKCSGLAISTVLLDNVGLYIENFSGTPYTEEENNLLMRFGKVFQQTYTRFLDLQKAETQAKEAQIEAALERVRARAMGMHKSEEVGEVSDLLFSELNKLNLDVLGCSVVVIDEAKDIMELWRARTNVAIKPFESTPFSGAMKLLKKNMPDWFPTFIKALEKRKDYLVDELAQERRSRFMNAIADQYKYSDAEKSQLLENAPEKITTHYIFFKLGYLALLTEKKLSNENLSITRRFVEVFEFSYTRFLDIKKAEEQAREAQIETALEKVRSVALSLKKSDEMLDVAKALYEQLVELGFTNIRNALIDMKNGDDDTFTDYDYSYEMSGTITQMSYHDDPTLEGQFKKMATTTNDFFELLLEGKELEDLKAMRIKNGEDEDPRLNNIDVLTYNLYSFGNGAIGISNFGVLSKEEKSILNRFSNVFTFAYKRYNDLVTSEQQARETQIELSLERIRAQVTSMKESEEILEIVVKMRTEFVSLGYDAAYFWYMKWTPDKYLKAMTSGDGTRIGMVMELPRKIHSEIKNLAEWEKSSEPLVVHVMDVEATLDYVNKMAAWGDFKQIDPNMPTEKDIRKMGGLTYVMARTMHGEIGYSLPGMVPHPPDDALSTLVRFAKVFDLAYRRFEDLKKSEQQFRESQIELGMERVRAKAMAMHSSEDLSAAVNVFFIELKTLGITPIRCGVGQIDEDTRTTNLTTTTSAKQGKSFEVIGKVKQTGHPVLDAIFENWKIQKDYFPVLEGAEIKKYYSVMNKQIPYPDYPEDVTQYGNMFYFKEGFVFAWTEEKLSEEELQIFRRFTSVLSLTYTRYIDLQQAELRAREAEQQASLDRVRGEIASMRTTEDLEKITPLIWRELTNLNINFFRCGVFIIDESSEVVKVYLTTPSGKSLAALHLPFKSSLLVKQAVKFWKKHKVYKEQWNREQFIAWARSLVEQGHIKNTEEYRGGEKPPEFLSLNFIPFAQGMLYVGSASRLTDEEIETAQKLADSFGVAYARYEDFQKLEAANHRKSLELEEARQLQLAMLPKNLPQLPNIDIAVYMQTATEVGGDYYDFNVGENGELTAVIGDATGHGMKAGTIVTITKSLFNSLASSKNMLDTFTKISKVIKDMKFRQLAMCLMMLKIQKNKLIISSAAMPPALIFRQKKGLVEEIELKGMPLGAMENFPYEIKDTSIDSGDTILLMSDGMPELHNGNNKMYGYDRIMNEFKSVGNKAPEEIIDHFKKSAAKWVNGNDADDDITFVVIKVK